MGFPYRRDKNDDLVYFILFGLCAAVITPQAVCSNLQAEVLAGIGLAWVMAGVKGQSRLTPMVSTILAS
jgi:hypothetical protein